MLHLFIQNSTLIEDLFLFAKCYEVLHQDFVKRQVLPKVLVTLLRIPLVSVVPSLDWL